MWQPWLIDWWLNSFSFPADSWAFDLFYLARHIDGQRSQRNFREKYEWQCLDVSSEGNRTSCNFLKISPISSKRGVDLTCGRSFWLRPVGKVYKAPPPTYVTQIHQPPVRKPLSPASSCESLVSHDPRCELWLSLLGISKLRWMCQTADVRGQRWPRLSQRQSRCCSCFSSLSSTLILQTAVWVPLAHSLMQN